MSRSGEFGQVLGKDAGFIRALNSERSDYQTMRALFPETLLVPYDYRPGEFGPRELNGFPHLAEDRDSFMRGAFQINGATPEGALALGFVDAALRTVEGSMKSYPLETVKTVRDRLGETYQTGKVEGRLARLALTAIEVKPVIGAALVAQIKSEGSISLTAGEIYRVLAAGHLPVRDVSETLVTQALGLALSVFTPVKKTVVQILEDKIDNPYVIK